MGVKLCGVCGLISDVDRVAIRLAAERLVAEAPPVVPSVEQRRVFGSWVRACGVGLAESA